MRGLLLNPIAILLTAACGLAICAAAGWNAHLRELLIAAVTVLLACGLAELPIFIVRRGDQLAMSQAALVGTVVHLFACAVGAAVVLLGYLPLGMSFIVWLLAFYWMTLIALAATFIAAVKQAPNTAKTG